MRQSRRSPVSRRGLFAAAGALLALYALNVALGMMVVKFGFHAWRLGDVGEFVLVLGGMACFVAGLVTDEAQGTPAVRKQDSFQPTQGGAQ